MRNLRIVCALMAAAVCLAAQAPPVPVLKAGEGLAITLGDGTVRTYGASGREAPMGGLALLVWMRLEGSEWASRVVRYRCKGADGPFACQDPKGHGRVEVGRALSQGCDLAFLAWIGEAQARWRQDYGEAVARARMEEVFAPFLGKRLPPGETLPALTPVWVGNGDLLRTSPDAFLRWLMEPDQGGVVVFGKRFLAGFWVEVRDLLGKEGWWFKTAVTPPEGAWVAGGRGEVLVVFRQPGAPSADGALARVRDILGLKP